MNSADDLQPGIEAMYQSFLAADALNNVTQEILDLATHLTGAENCSLMLLNGHGELYVLNSRGLASATLRASRVKVGEGISGQVVREGNPLLVEDIDSDERFSVCKRDRYRTGSFIAFPITACEKVIGVLNLNDKINGESFNPEDLNQAKLISLMAESALRSFLGDRHLNLDRGDIADVYRRYTAAEYHSREFVARISHDLLLPLHNIKGAAYSLRNASTPDKSNDLENFEIIEKEVNYLISYIDERVKSYERMQACLDDLEDREKYRKLLE